MLMESRGEGVGAGGASLDYFLSGRAFSKEKSEQMTIYAMLVAQSY